VVPNTSAGLRQSMDLENLRKMEKLCCKRFPRNIVAKVHGFKMINYLALGNQINKGPQEAYKPKELFND